MTRRLSDEQVRRLRMRAQRLSGPQPAATGALLREVFALQSQDLKAARLGVRARTNGVDAQAVIRGCNKDRSVVRTWAMRGTLHMLPAEDVRWVVDLLGPIFAAADRRRRLQLGLDDELCARALAAIKSVLANGPMTRDNLMQKIGQRGVTVDPTTNAAAHLCFYAAANGLICRGPDLPGDEPTYVLLQDWVGKQRKPRPDPLGELARRYLRAYAPAGVVDFAWWSGLTRPQARRGFDLIASELTEVQVAGQPAWMPTATPADRPPESRSTRPTVRLLGAFDAYLLGYVNRDLAMSPRFAKHIQAGGGWIHPAVVVDGQVIGTWRQRRTRDQLVVAIEPFEAVRPGLMPLLEAEAADLGRFLGKPATLSVEP